MKNLHFEINITYHNFLSIYYISKVKFYLFSSLTSELLGSCKLIQEDLRQKFSSNLTLHHFAVSYRY